MSNELQNMYIQRCEMNLEVDEAFELLGIRQEQDLFVLSANFAEQQNGEDDDEWQGYVQKTKDFQMEETSKIYKKLKQENAIQTEFMQKKIDEMEQTMIKMEKEFRNENEQLKYLVQKLMTKK